MLVKGIQVALLSNKTICHCVNIDFSCGTISQCSSPKSCTNIYASHNDDNLPAHVACLYLWDSLPSSMLFPMMTSSNGNIFRVTGPLCGEFTGPGEFPTQRPVTRSFDVYFDLRLNKRLYKQSWGWWFEMLLCPLWRHSNATRSNSLLPNCIEINSDLTFKFEYVISIFET